MVLIVLFVIFNILLEVCVLMLLIFNDNRLDVKLLFVVGSILCILFSFCKDVLVSIVCGLFFVRFICVVCCVIFVVVWVNLLFVCCKLNWLDIMVELILLVIILDIYYFYIFMCNY